ncbi:MAG: aldehyde dehydrogenase family protein [Methanosphaera stadtmanae]|nr:aldehyde dehydrogenase family protein [Methanosphaera stadtmanae]
MEILINGKHISKKETMDVINPYNNSIVDTIPIANKEDTVNAINSANKAKYKITSLSSREIYYRLSDACDDLKENKDKIAKIITQETGKPINGSMYELDRSIETLKFAAEESKRIYGENVPIDAGLGGEGVIAFTKKIPLGVVAAITPFNYPVNLAIHKLAPALAARNTVILKPSREAPLSGLMLAEILANHFPDGVVNTITGQGSLIGDILLSDDNVDKISFTGSVPVGKHIANNSGMKKVTLELGGNDPTVILEDANIDKAVSEVVNGAYLFSGQVCMGVKRVIVEKSIIDEFTDKLVKQSSKLKVGNPMDKNTDIGPLINNKSVEKIDNAVQDAIEKGATLEFGGKLKDNFYWPTVLSGVQEDMELVSNETFGPIAPIIEAKDIDEAIQIANNTRYGLNAGVFTENIHDALRCVNQIEAGSVFVNKASTFRTDNMPFGGFKNSGVGKEGVKYAVESMCRTKLIGFNLD